MKKFSIAALERFSGVKAHTFRIWEQRYHFLKPKRTATNLRYYTIDDLSQLFDITLLCKCHYKISKLDKLDSPAIKQLVEQLNDGEGIKAREINKLIISMFSRDAEEFEMILDKCIHLWGINRAIEEIIIPFLDRVPLLSYHDTSSEVHLVVNIIRKKIILGIERSSPFQRIDRKVLLFLPEGEHYDLTLLYMNYVAKREGYKILYMGTNISKENLENIAIAHRIDLLLTYIVRGNRLEVEAIAQFLAQNLPGSSLLISGYTGELRKGPVPYNVKLLDHKQIRQFISADLIRA